eukprot:scaffold4817_cov116-Skeletonema_marinoi.AAC.3
MQLAFDLDDFVEAVLVPFAPIMVTRLMTAVASFILLLSENHSFRDLATVRGWWRTFLAKFPVSRANEIPSGSGQHR